MSETHRQKLAREHEYASAGPRPVDVFTPIGRGLRRWVPDIAALPGDIADAAIYAARRGATGNRNTPSAGLGDASRQWALERLEKRQPKQQTEMSAPEDYGNPQLTALEEMVALANPAMWNPRLLMKPEVLGGLAAAFGGTPGAFGVIKNKGGNWLTGSVEDALKGLKQHQNPEEALAHAERSLASPGIAEDLAARFQAEIPRWQRHSALNNFIDKQLTRYVKNDMATPEDPIRALAEQGKLHYAPRTAGPSHNSTFLRGLHGSPMEGVSKSELAHQWEAASDNALDASSAGGLLDPNHRLHSPKDASWLSKVDPDAEVFYPTRNSGELGFDHLIDELSNAINPGSGLPRHLQFPVDRLSKVSVPQAVERVADINAWRAAMKAEADAARANNAATTLHKEYPEKGMRWVELKMRDLPDEVVAGMKTGRIPPDIKGRQELEDALKYEGNMMGHCVGGYCDEVLSGKSRIFSLRDAKGQPHVTIETAPTRRAARHEEVMAEMQRADPDYNKLIGKDWDIAYDAAQERVSEGLAPSIIQIKGKQNRKPNDEYLPFVQDFVRSGQWSDVGDLANAGMVRLPDQRFITSDQLSAAVRKIDPDNVLKGDTRWVLDQFKRDPAWWDAAKEHFEGFSSGGTVRTYPKPDEPPVTIGTRGHADIQAIITALREYHG